MNDAQLQLVLERFAKGDTPPPGMALKPGTVINTATDVYVLIDGDTTTTPTATLIGGLVAGTRVMVLFWPPHGAYVIGTVGAPGAAFEPLIVAEPGNLVVASGLSWRRVDYDSILAPWTFTVGTAPTGADIILDVLVNAVSVFTSPPHIPIGARYVVAVPDNSALVAGDEITVDVLQIGSTNPGSYLVGASRYYAA